MNIGLDFYKQFYYVAKNGSITRAANELCISQPAISKTIKLLESDLETTLFIRTKDGVYLTDAGKVLYEKIKTAMEIIESAENDLSSLNNENEGIINIGINKTITESFFLDFLKGFRKKYPNVKYRIYSQTLNNLIDKAKQGIIDVIINYSSDDTIDDFNIIKLFEVNDVLAATDEYSQYKGKKINIKDLENIPILTLAKTANYRMLFDDFCVANNIHIKPEMEINSLTLVKKFTIAGFGVGLLQEYGIKKELEDGTLFKLDIDFSFNKRNLCIFQKKSEDKLVVLNFINELKKYKL